MLDTNILISAIIFESKPMLKIIERLSDRYGFVLCSYIIDELHGTIKRKFPEKAIILERFLIKAQFELFCTPKILPDHNLFTIRDEKDEKILYSAIMADVDILVTGDKDLLVVDVERPEIISHLEFLQKY